MMTSTRSTFSIRATAAEAGIGGGLFRLKPVSF
jgi:hypothetical protein